jgi:ABC-type sugar transport system ATPase subunit
MASVSIRGLGKDRPNGPGGGPSRILGAISLDIADGELLVLVGPSGCGKTTLLRCIAGLEEQSRGDLFIDGQVMNQVQPRDRDIAMVFQSYALYPHMTVRDNLSFGLRMRKTPPDQVQRLVADAAAMLEIVPLLDRYPRQLSGGQRQRVAMGRAVVRRPKVFLFDEPLSNLDAALRQQMRIELLRLHRRLGATMVYVTHDQVEAMTLADRIAVMNRGAIEQVGPPGELYQRPKNLFVARFLGTPEINLVPGSVAAGRFADAARTLLVPVPGQPDGDVTLAVRSEDVHLCRSGEPGAVAAQVDVVEQLGWENLLHLRVGPHALTARCEARRSPVAGDPVGVRLSADTFHLFARLPGQPEDGLRLLPASPGAALAEVAS